MQLKYSKTNKRLIVGIILTALVAIPVLIGLFWLPYDPNEVDYSSMFQWPSFKHLFGTDDYGRDIYSRIVRGAGITFTISLFTVTVGALIGTIIGALTGYFGGIVDEILMRINDGLASFPSILLALVVVSLLDKGTWNICIALAIVFIPSFARIMRAEFISERNKDYVLNARLIGAGHFRIIFVHILPNTLPILFSAMLVGLNNAVLAEAGLSYLGLGVQPPEPSLGRMLSEAKVYIFNAPWYETFACLNMIVMILGITTISESFNISGISFNGVKRRVARLRKLEEKAENGKDISTEKEPAKVSLPSDVFLSDNSLDDDFTSDNLMNGKSLDETNYDNIALSVKNLSIDFIDEDGLCSTIKNVSFDLKRGEVLGVVGESGSGKSLTAHSIMGLLPENAVITKGSIYFEGKELVELSDSEYEKLRGKDISFVFQEPMTSLNPVLTVGNQVDEILDIHMNSLTEEEKKARVLTAFEEVGLKDVEAIYKQYPHELSGGMRQRVIIAMALITEAKIIIADEPTTALDADVADLILDLFDEIHKKHGTSIILISHDLRVIGRLADRTMIMQKGEIVEILNVNDTVERLGERDSTSGDKFNVFGFEEPSTEYGRNLLEAAFATKSYVKANKNNKELVRLENVNIYYKSRNKKKDPLNRENVNEKKGLKQVIFDASMSVKAGDVVGVVGESGCGKTTLVKAIAGLRKYVDGTIKVNCDIPGMVFQDPYSSLNPAFTVERILEEPLRLQAKKKTTVSKNKIKKTKAGKKNKLTKANMKLEILEVLRSIELDKSIAKRKISNLSGGQRQRIAIALTIICRRELIILDEPVSALDVTIQEQIIKLLMKLKDKYKLTFILISHDKKLVSRICNVVYNVENGVVSKK